MIINSFSIIRKDSIRKKTYTFSNSIEYFYSSKNTAGKTTFLRSILYCLGFSVPSTKKIDFENYYFECSITKDNGKTLIIKRNNNVVTIDDMDYDQKTDSDAIIGNIFSLDNIDLINNLLATIYIDQEKGWTLLNRGKIIGSNSFSIESFLRGLNDKDVTSLLAKLNAVEDDISRYSLMLNVADYQKEIEEHNPEIVDVSYDERAEAELGLIQNKINNLDKEIKLLAEVNKQNNEFVNYITKLGLQVEIEGKSYTINKNNLLIYNDIQTVNNIRLNKLKIEKNTLIEKRANLQQHIQPSGLFDSSTYIEIFNHAISKNRIDALQVKSILGSLEKEKEEIKDQVSKATRESNNWISNLNSYILKYWKELEIELDYRESYMFTRDLKSLSGALLYKIIIVFRLAYMRVLYDKTKTLFPIFIDSPSGREVKEEIVKKALSLFQRDFSSHQIFISSVMKYDDVLNIDDGSILVFDGLNAFDPDSLFYEN